jgi:hypothetical protein
MLYFFRVSSRAAGGVKPLYDCFAALGGDAKL